MAYLTITETTKWEVLHSSPCEVLPSKDSLTFLVRHLAAGLGRPWGTMVADVCREASGYGTISGKQHVWYESELAP